MKYTVAVPIELQNTIRKLPLDAKFKDTLALAQYGSDIWFTDKKVNKHFDKTEDGKDSIFCVIVNDADYKFIRWGAEKEIYDLPVGAVIRHDGRIIHEVRKSRKRGRFAVLIWDVPIEKDTNQLAKEILRELYKPNNRKLVEVVFSQQIDKASTPEKREGVGG
jgi:hypothetical protein